MQLGDITIDPFDPVVLGVVMTIGFVIARVRKADQYGRLEKRSVELGAVAFAVYTIAEVTGSLALSLVSVALLFVFAGLAFYSYDKRRKTTPKNE